MTKEVLQDALELLAVATFITPKLQAKRTTVINAGLQALAEPAQQEAIYGMNQDDWKDVVAAISKVRDGRGIYLGCRPADVFQEWFIALGTAKVKEKNT